MRIDKLERIGFKPKEASVYMACLELGSGTAQKIGAKANVPKSTTADILRLLQQKKLISATKKGSKTEYVALNPILLIDEAETKLDGLRSILPELEAVYNKKSSKPKIRFYDDKQGIEVALQELLKEAKDFIFLGNSDAAYRAYPEYFPLATKKRVAKKITSRGFTTRGEYSASYKKEDPQVLRTTKIIDSEVDIQPLGWIWNDKFVLFNTRGASSVLIIEDKDFVNFIRAMFEMVWKYVPEVSVGGTE